MSRRLNRDHRTKVRNIPRRLKALKRWADTFHNPQRSVFSEDEHYWNFKIPVEINLVQGKYSTLKTKADCAQAMINACSNLITATAGMNYSPPDYCGYMPSGYVYKRNLSLSIRRLLPKLYY
ncbi:DUF3916 domain-containing protein [Pantoea ananatis]|uniref:DUF3916 domain-containing protein n=1 Tax=Pantoea ananas TaxID=553 RepID=UPI002158106A|nr:DUF3916 domain-containing protein [Pantoea ananatis]